MSPWPHLGTRSCPRRGAQTQSHEATVPHLRETRLLAASGWPDGQCCRPRDLAPGVRPRAYTRLTSVLTAPCGRELPWIRDSEPHQAGVGGGGGGGGGEWGWEPRAVSLGPSRPGLSQDLKAQAAEHSAVPPAGGPARWPSTLVAPGSRFRMGSNRCDSNHVSGAEYLPSQKLHEL